MKKTYQVTFKAELSEDDVRAMKKCFFDAMNESMDICDLWDLELTEVKDTPKTFNHVNDIWSALEACETLDQIYDILDNIPAKFGTWWADVTGESEIEVTSQWWDQNQEDMMTESQTFEVALTDEVED